MPDDQTIVEGDAGFLGMASRLNPLQLQPGMCQLVENMRLDRGVAQTRKGAKRLAESIGNIGEAVTLPFQLGTDKTISSLTRGGTGNLTATATLTAHGYATNDRLNIRGASPAQFNGDFFITVTNANTFTYTMAADPGADATGTLIANKGPVIQATYTGGIVGAGIYSSPRLDNSNEYIVLAGPNAAYLWRQGANLQTISYPATDTLVAGDDIEIIQAFDKLYILRTRDESILRPTGLTQTGGTTTVTLTAHGYSTNEVVRISGSTAAAHNNDHIITSTGANTFTFASTLQTTSTVTITSANPGVVSWTSHGFSNGQAVQFTTTGALPTNLTAGTRYYVVNAAADTFQVASTIGGTAINTTSGTQSGVHTAWSVPDVADYVTGNTILAQRVQPALVWDGILANNFTRVAQGTHPLGVTYSRLPSTSIATYFNNSLVIARNRDEVMISDVFDGDTFDPLGKAFRANSGSNDYIVALHPYADGQALVFCRKSIWLASVVLGNDGISIDPAASSLQLLTDEIGCSARRSIATAGVFVFFLSDNGVYRLDNQFDLKLRGNTQTLSDPIADLISNINAPAAHLSNGIYFGNRYYLAVPLGSSTAPNALFAYNMLNQQWETKDTYGFPLDRLLITDYGTQRRLYASTLNGRLFLLDEQDNAEDDTLSGLGTTTVQGTLLTRRYGWGSLNAKRLTRSKASVVLPAGAACTLDAVTTDFDADFTIATLTNSTASQEDYTLKAPLRCKATALDLRYRTTAGRPILRQISAESVRSNFDPTETRTLN